MKEIVSKNPPRGHYSTGMVSGNTLYVSGQTSADPATGLPAEGGFEKELQMALEKMESVLLAAGCTRSNVVMCHIYLTSMEDWGKADLVYRQFFGGHRPARIVLPVGALANGCRIELDAVAELDPA